DVQAFLASLAVHSVGQGNPQARADALETARQRLEEAVAAGAAPGPLGALWRLTLEDADPDAEDGTGLLAGPAAPRFAGRLPLTFLATLLAPLESETWTDAGRRRLTVLLAARAFDVGLEAGELLALAGACPALGAVIDPRQKDAIAQLRGVYDLRVTRP